MSRLSRRVFIGGSLAACGGLALPAFASPVRRLRFGVLTDIHIHKGHKPCEEVLEKELRWLDEQKVEAVVFPGDLTDGGLVAELERFAAVWEKVFPNFTAADGRRVERVLVSGNHDLFTDEVREAWTRVLGEKWELVWKREVKGVTFVGAQHASTRPPVEGFFRAHAAEFDPARPFVYVQHPHPKDTCHGEFAVDARAVDSGFSTRALSAFPNAIALSGHSHLPLTDERMVWQGAFTSIGCGCAGVIPPTGLGWNRANAGMPSVKNKARLQPPALMYGSAEPFAKPDDLKIPRETVPTMQDGRAGLVIDLYDDRLVLHRRSFFFDEPIGEDWTVPLPASVGGPFDFTVRAAKRRAPQFAADAEVNVESFAKAPEEAGDDYRGKKPCIRVSYPCANAEKDGRVFDYAVTAIASGKRLFTRELIARDFHLPKRRAGLGGYCLLEPESVPVGQKIVFEVVPRDEFGTAGRAIRSKPFERGN